MSDSKKRKRAIAILDRLAKLPRVKQDFLLGFIEFLESQKLERRNGAD